MAFALYKWRAWRVSRDGLSAMQQHQIVQDEVPVGTDEEEKSGLVPDHASTQV